MSTFLDVTGKKFNHLTALRRSHDKGGKVFWVCRCDCGNEAEVESYKLRTGHTTSCGCYRDLRRSESHTTHGMSGSRTYLIWSLMLHRCNNPNSPIFKHYGGRGIKVCARWLKFEEFLSDMGEAPPHLTLERLDNEKGYEPSNCTWVSRKEQVRNRRNTLRLTLEGETKTIGEWADLGGVSAKTIKARLQRGWAPEMAVFQPLKKVKASTKEKAV